MNAPTYRWFCHKCVKVNDVGVTHCQECGFPANARGAEIGLARGDLTPSPGRAVSENEASGLTFECPQCKVNNRPPTNFGFVGAFVCIGCGVSLKSNHNLLLVIAWVIWIPLVILSYQRWPTFTFFFGDWLLLLLVAGLIFVPFSKVSVIADYER